MPPDAYVRVPPDSTGKRLAAFTVYTSDGTEALAHGQVLVGSDGFESGTQAAPLVVESGGVLAEQLRDVVRQLDAVRRGMEQLINEPLPLLGD